MRRSWNWPFGECLIEDHYKKPMDIEWAKDGRRGELFIVQARPETVQSQKTKNVLEEYILRKKESTLRRCGSRRKNRARKANVIKDVAKSLNFKKAKCW